jgi:hypothetical protein
MDISRWTVNTAFMKAVRLVCTVGGHKWHRFRREGVDMRECKRCGYLVRRDADPPRMMDVGGM